MPELGKLPVEPSCKKARRTPECASSAPSACVAAPAHSSAFPADEHCVAAPAHSSGFPADEQEGPSDWRARLERDGFCILTVRGDAPNASEVAHLLPTRLFGAERIRAVGPPAEVSERVLATRGIVRDETFNAHTDGHAYGDLYPDYFLLYCEKQSDAGGENFIVDGEAVLADLQADPQTAWVAKALQETPIDQTSKVSCVSPAVQRAPGGRRMFKARLPGPPTMFKAQRVAVGSKDPVRDEEMIQLYHAAIQRQVDSGKRFKLQAGQAILVDNYRMFHGREPYSDPERLLWRIWFWTDSCMGVPEGELFSTPGSMPGDRFGGDTIQSR